MHIFGDTLGSTMVVRGALHIYLYWYSYIVYFVCDSISEFGAMDSTSFLGVFLPQPASYFSEPVIFRNLYHIFLASVGLSLGLFNLFLPYFSVPYFGLACDHGNSFLCLEE